MKVDNNLDDKQNSSKFQYTKLVRLANKEGRYKVWETKSLKDGQRAFLKSLDAKGAISICCNNETGIEFLVECSRSTVVDKLLRDREIAYDVQPIETNGPVVNHRTPKLRSGLTSSFTPPWKTKDRIIDWKDFHPLSSIYSWMEELEKLFPSTCTVCSIGSTVEGRNIKLLKISNSNATNTGAWLDGCIHAREWISASAVTFIADYIARNFASLPEHITNKDWYFLPVANPDGYHYTHTSDRLWRKNRSRNGNTIVGVDLNRNFGFSWGLFGANSASTTDPTNLNYRGPEPFSEPEAAAIKDLILYAGTPFKLFLTFHSCSEVIAFPWCYTSDPCPDYVNLLEGASAMAKAIYEASGRMYKVGNFKDIMYSAQGTSIDWSYGTVRIPFSYLVELRSKEHRFILPKNEIYDCCKEALAAVLAIAEFSDKRKCLNCTVLCDKNR